MGWKRGWGAVYLRSAHRRLGGWVIATARSLWLTAQDAARGCLLGTSGVAEACPWHVLGQVEWFRGRLPGCCWCDVVGCDFSVLLLLCVCLAVVECGLLLCCTGRFLAKLLSICQEEGFPTFPCLAASHLFSSSISFNQGRCVFSPVGGHADLASRRVSMGCCHFSSAFHCFFCTSPCFAFSFCLPWILLPCSLCCWQRPQNRLCLELCHTFGDQPLHVFRTITAFI